MGEKQRNEVMVSVFCLTYNHEKYIRKALEGFVNQETTFNYEVLVHDDASTDNTPIIIREFQEKYPNIIKPIIQNENQFSKPDHKPIISTFLLPKARGKYCAWCEGDDYWINPYKLQMQVDALEREPGCVACFCAVRAINREGNELNIRYPFLNTGGVYNSEEYINYCLYPGKMEPMPFHLSGFLLRKEIYLKYTEHPPEYRCFFKAGDIPLFLYCGLQGQIYYINKEMSYYRTGISASWSGRLRSDNEKFVKFWNEESEAIQSFDDYTGGKYHLAAEKGANLRKFLALYKANNFVGMHKRNMRLFWSQFTLKKKMRLFALYFFPKVVELRRKLRQHG